MATVASVVARERWRTASRRVGQNVTPTSPLTSSSTTPAVGSFVLLEFS